MLKRMYGQEMPHSQTAYKPTARRGKAKEQQQTNKLCDLQDDATST